ncbi:hypothetical protein D1007_26675 [Hordeum vulgare]|nr:hypothetical protein D1007_26675 [Hordeum vulgare]
MVKFNPKSTRVNMVNAIEAENSSDVIMGNLLVNDIPAKVLFDSGASHYFMSRPFFVKQEFDYQDLPKPTSVVSPGLIMNSSRIVRDVTVKMGDYSFSASPIALCKSDIDLILGMDWLAMNKAFLDCQAKQVKLTHPSEDVIIFAAHDDMIRLFSLNEKVEFVIELEPGTEPVSKRPYKLGPEELKDLKKRLDEQERLGLIRPSSSPWGCGVIFVKKKDGTDQVCVDYRPLNKKKIRFKYPLPNINELFEQLKGAKIFSKLDLTMGYHQICNREEDIPKTAFRSSFGSYEYTVMSFGLANAPPTFYQMMNYIFSTFKNEFVLLYLDDILVFSETEEEHEEHLRLVLDKLREHKFYAKFSKCEFWLKEVVYLGHIISAEGIQVDPSKVQDIVEWEPPQVEAEHQRPAGLLHPLPIPRWKFDHVEMDFVTGFPMSKKGNDGIFIVIDKLRKVAHFLPVKESISAAQLAELYTSRIVSLHGVPMLISSDHGSIFTFKFWDSFQSAMGTKI